MAAEAAQRVVQQHRGAARGARRAAWSPTWWRSSARCSSSSATSTSEWSRRVRPARAGPVPPAPIGSGACPRRELPTGRYLNCPIDLSPDAGGQTRAMLMRNRIFVTEGGIAPMVATFNARTDLARAARGAARARHAAARDQHPEHLRALPHARWERIRSPDDPDDATRPSARPGAARTCPRTTRPRSSSPTARRSGSPTAPTPSAGRSTTTSAPTGRRTCGSRSSCSRSRPPGRPSLQRVGARRHRRSASSSSVGQWFKRFVRHLAGDERSFLFIDSRFSAQHLVPMRARTSTSSTSCTTSTSPRRGCGAPTSATSTAGWSDKVDGIDAFVTLTARQQDDIAQRRGRTIEPVRRPQPGRHARPRTRTCRRATRTG